MSLEQVYLLEQSYQQVLSLEAKVSELTGQIASLNKYLSEEKMASAKAASDLAMEQSMLADQVGDYPGYPTCSNLRELKFRMMVKY